MAMLASKDMPNPYLVLWLSVVRIRGAKPLRVLFVVGPSSRCSPNVCTKSHLVIRDLSRLPHVRLRTNKISTPRVGGENLRG